MTEKEKAKLRKTIKEVIKAKRYNAEYEESYSERRKPSTSKLAEIGMDERDFL